MIQRPSCLRNKITVDIRNKIWRTFKFFTRPFSLLFHTDTSYDVGLNWTYSYFSVHRSPPLSGTSGCCNLDPVSEQLFSRRTKSDVPGTRQGHSRSNIPVHWGPSSRRTLPFSTRFEYSAICLPNIVLENQQTIQMLELHYQLRK